MRRTHLHESSAICWRGPLFRAVVYAAPLLLLPGCSDPRQEIRPYPEIKGRTAQITEELRIDGNREDLVPIFAVAVSDSGTIALIQSQDGAIRFYSAAGELMGSFGRTGDGPGEFRVPFGLGWQGDTVWVLDLRTPRISYIGPTLELARTERFPQPVQLASSDKANPPVTFNVVPQGPAARDGGITAVLAPHQNDPPSPFTDFGTLAYVDSLGIVRNVILPLHQEPAAGPIPNRTMYTIAPQASRAAVATATLDGEDAGTFSLVAVNLAGDTVVARRYSLEGESIPARVADSLVAVYVRRRSAATGRAWTERIDIPPVYPPILGLLIGNDGSFWVRARLRDGSVTYLVLASDGEPLGRVALPTESVVGAATRDRIWVIEEGLWGVQSVVRYRVEWH